MKINNLFLKISKYILMITPLIHLVLCTAHIDALTKLSSQLSGFAMFMFILTGLLCLFNATRVSDVTIKDLIKSTIFILINISFGIWLIIFYTEGSVTNNSSDQVTVTLAMVLSIAIICAEIVGLVFLFLSRFLPTKEDNTSKEILNGN